ncbi:MAG: hypothetical protein WAS56_12450 [Saprospiraceae bacterium]
MFTNTSRSKSQFNSLQVVVLLAFIFVKSDLNAQTCFGLLTSSEIILYDTLQLPIYSENKLVSGVELRNIILVPGHTKWVKKLADKNCVSPKIEDCLVWCLENIPAESKTYFIVTDTATIKNFTYETIYIQRGIIKAGQKIKRQVLCDHEINDTLLSELRQLLENQGYEISRTKKSKILAALIEFQKDQKLAYGYFEPISIELLKKLKK